MPPMPAEADAPSDLVTPLTASPAASAAWRAASSTATRRQLGIEQIEIGNIARQLGRVGQAGEAILGRDPRHRDGALGQLRRRRALMSLVDTTAWRLPTSTRSPTSSPSERSRFLDLAVAHLDRQRHRAHRDRIGGIGAGAARGRHQALGEIGERGLIEQGGHGGFLPLLSGRASAGARLATN